MGSQFFKLPVHAPCQLIITRDINFSHTNWSQMCSTNDYETEVLARLINHNITNCSCDKLDVVLIKETESINQCTYQHQLSREYKIAGNICSDLTPLKTEFEIPQYGPTTEVETHSSKLPADWYGLNKAIEAELFRPHC